MDTRLLELLIWELSGGRMTQEAEFGPRHPCVVEEDGTAARASEPREDELEGQAAIWRFIAKLRGLGSGQLRRCFDFCCRSAL